MIVMISEERRNRRVEAVKLRTLTTLICTIFVVQNLIASSQVVAASRQNQYDPEQQDGIPVFSARSISTKPSLDDDWGASDQVGVADQPAQQAQRRQGDGDLDDGMEDDDDDEYKSGSSPRESVENPSYGESSRSARDGDEIEEFFDKHLGPPQEATAADESSASVSRQEVPAVDPDDHYEAAASGPISNIIHSLLSHGDSRHKRPFLKIAATTTTATDSANPAPSASSSSSTSPSSPSLSLVSATVEKDDKSAPPSSTMKASQSAQSFVETAPMALAFAPAAAPSSLVYQEPTGQESASPQQDPALSSSGVQEIYIGRRPSVMNYLQKAYAQQQQQQHQQQQQQPQLGYSMAGSSNLWRGAPSSIGASGQAATYEQDQMSDYARYPIAASYLYQREQSTEAASPASGDDEQTVTYNLSFGGAPSTSDDTSAADAAVGQDGGGQDVQQAGDTGAETNESPPPPSTPQHQQHAYQQQLPQGYVPYSTRYSASSTRSHNNYYNSNNNPYQGPYYRQTGGFVRATGGEPAAHHQHQRQMAMIQQQRPHYHHYRPSSSAGASGSTRYHRDPSESLNNADAVQMQEGAPQRYAGVRHAGANYRGKSKKGKQVDDDQEDTDESANAQAMERQRLLASLDREIKASPHYRNNNAAAAAAAATALARMYASRPVTGGPRGPDRQHLVAIKTLTKSYQGDDLDSYNSFHSEEDPYKSFTSASRMINYPTGYSGGGSQLTDSRNGPSIHNGGGGDRIQAADSNFATNQSPGTDQPLGLVLNGTNSSSFDGQTSSSSPSDWNRVKVDKQEHMQQEVSSQRQQHQQVNNNLLTGPLTSDDAILRKPSPSKNSNQAKLSPSKSESNNKSHNKPNSRVRREDPDEREIDGDADDDGVWVDDDEDDDSRQQSSDVNETAQEPEGEEETDDNGQQEDETSSVPRPTHHNQMNPPGVIGGPHGYELSPNDLMIYHG